MVNILAPLGPLNQLADACFLLAALVSDVLLIRFFLMGAYAFLFFASLVGEPKWPNVNWTGSLGIDGLSWSTVCFLLHLNAFTRMVLDERHIRFKTEDQEQLWRFFYRRGGMGRLEMKQAFNYGTWVRVAAGNTIVSGPAARLRFFVLVEGRASISSTYKGVLSEQRPLHSGTCFDMGLLSVFGVFNGMVKSEEHMFSATAVTDCLLYSWTIDELGIIATQLAPAVGTFFRNFTLCQLGMFLSHRLYPNQDLVCATGELEPKGVLSGGVRSRDFTDPLRPYEQHKPTLRGFMGWLGRSFNPFPPAGLRHTALPITGIMARNRLVAVKAAKAKAAIEAADEAEGLADEVAGDASPHGGALAVDILTSMQSLRQLHSTTVEQLLEGAASGWVSTGTANSGGSHLAGRSRLAAASRMAVTLQLDAVTIRHAPPVGRSFRSQGSASPRRSHDSSAKSGTMRSPAASLPRVDELL